MATSRSFDVIRDQTVITYQPDRWPEVVITGHPTRDIEHGFFMEHIIVLPGAPAGALFGALKTAIALAWDYTYEYVEFVIHDEHPHARQLDLLARRQGFVRYHVKEDGCAFYVLWRRPE